MNKLVVATLLILLIIGCGTTTKNKDIPSLVHPSRADCVQPFNGLVGWWPGDGNANDELGISNGEEMNGAEYVSGLIDQSFYFDGKDDYITIQNTDKLNL